LDEFQLLKGSLRETHFPELLLTISQQKLTGVLHISHPPIEKDIYFQDGRAVFARSNDDDERLGELLLQQGKISYRQLDDSAKKIVPGLRLGTILVQDGNLKASDLYHGVIDQVQHIIYNVFEWEEGEYAFQVGELPNKEVITLSLSTPDVILAGISLIRKWSWIKKTVGPLETVFRKRIDWPIVVKKMSITPAIHSLIDLLEHPLRLETILRLSRATNFETCKLLWAFLMIGIIEKVEPGVVPQGHPLEPPKRRELTNDDTRIFQRKEEKPAVVEPTGTQPVPIESLMVLPQTNDEALIKEDNLEGAIDGPQPILDLSFSDLADLTDDADVAGIPDFLQSELTKPDQELERTIQNFNEVHRYIYETVRIEIGSNVHGFLGKILKKIFDQFPLVFVGVQMNEFGELNTRSLIANIQSNLVEQYYVALECLIQEEGNLIRSFLDPRKVEAIEAGISRILEKQKAPLT
jgi:hypothetical protein